MILTRARNRVGPPGPPPTGREHLVWQQDPPHWVLPPERAEAPPSTHPDWIQDEVSGRWHLAERRVQVPESSFEQALNAAGNRILYDDVRAGVFDEDDVLIPENAASYVDVRDFPGIWSYLTSGYGIMNAVLRGEESEADFTPSFWRATLDHIQEMTSEMRPFEEAYLLYRGISSPGQIHDTPNDQFLSTSREVSVGLSAGMTDLDGTLLELHVDPDVTGIVTSNEESPHKESETIIGPGHQIDVVDARRVYVEDPDRSIWFIRARVSRPHVVDYVPVMKAKDRPGPPGPPPQGQEHLVWQQDPPHWVLPPEKPRHSSGWERQMDDVEGWTRGADGRWRLDEEWGQHPLVETPLERMLLRQDDTVTIKDLFAFERPEGDITKEPGYVKIERDGDHVLRRYIGDDYGYINNFLRDPEVYDDLIPSEELEEMRQLVSEMSSLMTPLERSYVIYRGVDLVERMRHLEPVDSFLSCSRSPFVASGFAKTQYEGEMDRPIPPGLFMELHVEPSVTGMLLSNQERGLQESETLLGIGNVLNVVDMRMITVENDAMWFARAVVTRPEVDDQAIERIEKSRDRPGPPGPPPAWNPNLIWKPETSSWVLPPEAEEVEAAPVPEPEPEIVVTPLRRRLEEDGLLYLDEVRDGQLDTNGRFQAESEPAYVNLHQNAALMDYVWGGGHFNLNEYLRGVLPDGVAGLDDMRAWVGDIVRSLKTFEKPYVLYRSVNLSDPLEEIDIVDGMMSTSRALSIPLTLFRGNHLLELHVDPDVEGAVFSYNDSDEMETLIGPGHQMEVIDAFPFSVYEGYAREVMYVRARVSRPKAGQVIQKAPPGPPPRDNLCWWEPTKRWRLCRREDAVGVDVSTMGLTRLSQRIDWGKRVPYEIFEDLGEEVVESFVPEEAPSYVWAAGSWAMREYTEDDTGVLNQELRSGRPLSNDLQYMADMIQSEMKEMRRGQILYRAVNGVEDLYEGADVWEIDQFLSCSRRPDTVFKEFMVGSTGVFMEIVAEGSAYGMTLSNDDTAFPEDETILDMGQMLIIEERRTFTIKDAYGQVHERPFIRARVRGQGVYEDG